VLVGLGVERPVCVLDCDIQSWLAERFLDV
jgi:hypothetical protein